MKINNIFGNNIKYYRFQKNYSQEKLAEIADLNVTYLSGLESGKHMPSFEKLDKLSKALNIEPYQLFKKNNFTSLPNRIIEYRK